MSVSARTITGDLQVPRVLVTDFNSQVLQKVRDFFGLWQGEWFLDHSAGFPWLQRVLGVMPAPSATEVAALIRQGLLSITGIVNVVATATLNRSTRAFAYSFQATTNSGATITGGSGTPFQVTGAP